jgi:hypothetical protein
MRDASGKLNVASPAARALQARPPAAPMKLRLRLPDDNRKEFTPPTRTLRKACLDGPSRSPSASWLDDAIANPTAEVRAIAFEFQPPGPTRLKAAAAEDHLRRFG